MRNSSLFKHSLFNTELTQIENGWLLTERTISILGIEYPRITYFKTLKSVMTHLIKREEQAEKRKKERKKTAFKFKERS